MAPHAALWIPELLEQILLNTDMCTLLTSAQRVCHYWKEVITKSKPLQQALFFEPVKTQKNHAQQTRIRNPLLEKLFWPSGIDTSTLQTNSTEDETIIQARIAYKKPIYAHKKASWQRMLIQQPATSTIGFFPGCENGPCSRHPDGMRHYVMDVYSSDTIDDGKIHLRMGDLYHPLYTNGLECYDDKWVFWYQNPDTLDPVMREILPEWDCDAMIKRALEECDIIVSAWFMFGVTFPRRYTEDYNRRLDGFEQWINKLLDDHPDYEPTVSWAMNGAMVKGRVVH